MLYIKTKTEINPGQYLNHFLYNPVVCLHIICIDSKCRICHLVRLVQLTMSHVPVLSVASTNKTEQILNVFFLLNIFQVINWLILVLTIIGCCLVLLLFYKERKHRKIAHNYVISMCLADIVHGGFGSGMVIVFCTGLKLSDDLCPIVTSVLLISVYVSLFSLTTTAIDRYMAVCHPLMYRTKMRHRMSFGEDL